MIRTIIIIILVFVGTVSIFSKFENNNYFDNSQERVDFEMRTGQIYQAQYTLIQLSANDLDNVHYHYQLIENHFKYNLNDDFIRGDISDYYTVFANSEDPKTSDIGHYCLGLIDFYRANFQNATLNLKKVQNDTLYYLNYTLGNVYWQLDLLEEAEGYFRKEIESNGNLKDAYYNLSILLYRQDKIGEIKELLANPNGEKYVVTDIKKIIYFKSFKPFKYAKATYGHIFYLMNFWGALAALLITGSWIFYLRKLDVFEPEKRKYIIYTLVLGMLFSFIVEPLSDVNIYFFGFYLNGEFWHDFLYATIGIGMIEELAKIIPLLLLLKYTKEVNEPYDYILYGSVSALGFACVENFIYFDDSSLQIIHGRALTAVVFHMFLTSVIAYGMILNQYKRYWNPKVNFFIFFVIASILHGFYDVMLMNELVSEVSFFSLILLLIGIVIWNTFKNNALNHSNFYDKNKVIDRTRIQSYLLYSMSAIFLFEYIAMAISYTPSIAGEYLSSSLFSGSILIIFLTVNLSKFSFYKNYWAPIDLFIKPDKNYNYDEIAGHRLEIEQTHHQLQSISYLPNSGFIAQRLTISNEIDWYAVQIDSPKLNNSYLPDVIIVRTRTKEVFLKTGTRTLISFYLIPKDIVFTKENLEKEELVFGGYAAISIFKDEV